MSNLFQKAAVGEWLSPEQRTLLKLFWGFVLSIIVVALSTAATAIEQYIVNEPDFNWQRFWGYVIGAVSLAVLAAIRKYFTAQADTQQQGELRKNEEGAWTSRTGK